MFCMMGRVCWYHCGATFSHCFLHAHTCSGSLKLMEGDMDGRKASHDWPLLCFCLFAAHSGAATRSFSSCMATLCHNASNVVTSLFGHKDREPYCQQWQDHLTGIAWPG